MTRTTLLKKPISSFKVQLPGIDTRYPRPPSLVKGAEFIQLKKNLGCVFGRNYWA